MRIEAAAARTQARIDSGRQPVIGVNSYRPTEDMEVDVLKVDNAEVRARQLSKLQQLKGTRNVAAVDAALSALTAAAKAGKGNLLDLAIQAARARATVGEISLALEKAYGRHVANIHTISGVYRKEAGKNEVIDRVKSRGGRLRKTHGEETSYSCRKDGPGRPRSRPEGHCNCLR